MCIHIYLYVNEYTQQWEWFHRCINMMYMKDIQRNQSWLNDQNCYGEKLSWIWQQSNDWGVKCLFLSIKCESEESPEGTFFFVHGEYFSY